jgi:glutaredoxin 3
MLDARGVAYEEVLLDGSGDSADALRALTGSWTTPQVVVDGTPVGGYRELRRLDRIGRLAALVPAAA